jgi:hypothetical protein
MLFEVLGAESIAQFSNGKKLIMKHFHFLKSMGLCLSFKWLNPIQFLGAQLSVI